MQTKGELPKCTKSQDCGPGKPAKIAEELKISNTTLGRWKQEVQNPFVPVLIENEHDEVIKEATITIRSDSGFSIRRFQALE